MALKGNGGPDGRTGDIYESGPGLSTLYLFSHLFLTMMLRKVLSFPLASKGWNKDSAKALDNVSVVSVF